jgi:predicted transcriptional regulator
MNNKRQFGELESYILNQIKQKKKATVSDIHFLLKDSVAYTTVMTVMNRLFEKKILKREKSQRSYIYWICNPNYVSTFLQNIKQKLFSNNSVDMVLNLIENSPSITKEDLDKIDELIQKMKKDSKTE